MCLLHKHFLSIYYMPGPVGILARSALFQELTHAFIHSFTRSLLFHFTNGSIPCAFRAGL